MATDKNFSASGENTEEGTKTTKSPVIELGGEKFDAKPFVQGIVLMDFLEASDGGGVSSVVAFKDFLKEATTEEVYAELDSHLRNAPVEIGVKEISEAVGKLVTEYTSRPTKASAQ